MSKEKAVNGQQAVVLFQKNGSGRLAVILMDIMMPVMSGYEATRCIRSLGYQKNEGNVGQILLRVFREGK